LRYQLNPHFLFNTLNSIRTLMIRTPQAAQDMLLKLADFCRISLYRHGQELVSLDEEFQMIRHYLSIEEVRWGDRMHAAVNLEPAVQNSRVPAFCLQPLVENAIKFGQFSGKFPLHVNVTAQKRDGLLHIEVSNTGRWFSPDDPDRPIGAGVGLGNLRKRLARHYGRRATLSQEEKNGLVIMTITLPDS
jgi:LytS/YehU family sensor histidine kinase